MSQIRYRVPEVHHAETTVEGKTLTGSIHHREMREFTGLVTRSHDDGSHDIVIFPPDRPPVHIARVKEGGDDEAGTLSCPQPASSPEPSPKRR